MAGEGPAPADELLTVTVVSDDTGYGMKVSGDNPVYIQSVKEHGPAWRAGIRAGDRILRVDNVPVHRYTHQRVVHMIKENRSTTLTVQQNASRHKTPITAPVPVDSEQQHQLSLAKVNTLRLMLEKEEKHVQELKHEVQKVPDVRKQAEIESGELRCAKFRREMEIIAATLPSVPSLQATSPSTPRLNMRKSLEKSTPSPPHTTTTTSFLSGLPRSLSNLTGQSLRNLRQARQSKIENQPPVPRDEKRGHNNTVPLVPTTCLDSSPPPLPPRSIERPKRISLNSNSPVNPLAKPKPGGSNKFYPLHQSVPAPQYNEKQFTRSAHSLDGELDGPQPNSIALQMSYPLVNAPPPPLQNDRGSAPPILHARSQSSPEHLDHSLGRSKGGSEWEGPPGTPPPPYNLNTTPCADPQRAIISMEEEESPTSENSYTGLFSNLREVLESKARTAVLLHWIIGERRCPRAILFLSLTEGYRSLPANANTLRRWAYEIHSTFVIPKAVLQLSGADENMANEIEQVLENDYEKEELLRNVFRKARQKAKEQLTRQLAEFQSKRQLGLGSLFAPDDVTLHAASKDKHQEQVIVDRLMVKCLKEGSSASDEGALCSALLATATLFQCRPATIAGAVSGPKPSFLQRDKQYKQRLKQLAKAHPQPFVVRGHHLQLWALRRAAHCHVCQLPLRGLAPQCVHCADCNLRVHRSCAKCIEENCCLEAGSELAHNRISRLMERIHSAPGQDSSDKKAKKSSTNSNFLNMERSYRRMEEEVPSNVDPALSGEPRREGSSEEPSAPDLDVDTNDCKEPDKDNSWRPTPSSGRGVNRAESCRERDAPRRGKHRNASDPNRLTAHNNHDLEPGAPTAPSGSSSSSSLSSRSNESNTVANEQQASQSDWSEEEEPLAAQWADSVPPHVLVALPLTPAQRKRQEIIHELIVSEGSHVRWLKVLDGVFLQPLEKQPSLLPPEELKALFPNLPAVKERHIKLYADLRALRSDNDHVVDIGAVADVMLDTLGGAGYAGCVARFCRSQRRALDALRERRRKHKELAAFLAARETLPLCARLQLRDLLACVWQRLTKYQLLLENVVQASSDEEGEPNVEKLRRALATAKCVLTAVDDAVRRAENDHRLKTIQSKLEVRAAGEWEELKRLDLTAKTLKYEGELSIKTDGNKKLTLLALMFEDTLVLLQREGDKFLLKPISQTNAQPLSPVIRWDKVLFRPNAAVRSTFFLMNINGVQMHELSAVSHNDYQAWVKLIQEAPLAKLTELRPIPAGRHSDPAAAGTNVSRNPSDASEKSSSDDIAEVSEERERSEERRTEEDRGEERRPAEDKEEGEEKTQVNRLPAVGRISLVSSPSLCGPRDVTVSVPQAHTAHLVLTPHERLRRLDEQIALALRSKSEVVAELLGVPADSYCQIADMAVADTLGQVESSACPCGDESSSLQQFLLAAHAQAQQLTEIISAALSVRDPNTDCDPCDHCTSKVARTPSRDLKETSFDMLTDLDAPYNHQSPAGPKPVAGSVCVCSSSGGGDTCLARLLLPPAAGLSSALRAALRAAPCSSQRAAQHERRSAAAAAAADTTDTARLPPHN